MRAVRSLALYLVLLILAACGSTETPAREASFVDSGETSDVNGGAEEPDGSEGDEDADLSSDDASQDDAGERDAGSDSQGGASDVGGADDTGDSDVADPSDTTGDPANLLPNAGFERGASWLRDPASVSSYAWSRSGDPIYESGAQFEALEGRAALKIWGAFGETYPNTNTTYHEFTGAAAGDRVGLIGSFFSHPDDALSADTEVALVLVALDESGGELQSVASTLDAAEASTWTELSATLTVPDGTASVRAGVRFVQSSVDGTGSVYVDGFRATSTGTLIARPTRELVWHDEFDGVNADGTGLDSTKWFRQVWPAYHVNAERQAYKDREENAFVSEGLLTLRAIRGDVLDAEYSSGRIETDGLASWRYGRFEARIQLPTTRGTWPAFWMLPESWVYGGWPDSGEIDIMEYVGCDPELVHATVHTEAYNHIRETQRGDSMWLGSANSAFHTYAADWTPERIVFTTDGREVFRFENDGQGNAAAWPFDQRFYLILNLAVGGFWGGYCGVDTSAWPQDVLVDWVRVYQTPDEIEATNALPGSS